MSALKCMNRITHSRTLSAFTALDLVIVVATVVLLALLVPSLSRPGRRGPCPPNCMRNLQFVGLAFRLFSNDHEEKFPFAVSTSQGGSAEYRDSLEVFRHFQAASNELSSPLILHCPSDARRAPALEFVFNFGNKNLSYFLALDADETGPAKLLAGDRNLTTNGRLMSGFLVLRPDTRISLAPALHVDGVNVALSDGSVAQIGAASVRRLLGPTTNPPVRLVIP